MFEYQENNGAMRQILYTSASTAEGGADLSAILEQSRHNNALDGITGLLWSDRYHFIQVLEGPEISVDEAMARIGADSRHHRITVLQDRSIEEREFGYWSMVQRPFDEASDVYDRQMQRLLSAAATPATDHLLTLIAGDGTVN